MYATAALENTKPSTLRHDLANNTIGEDRYLTKTTLQIGDERIDILRQVVQDVADELFILLLQSSFTMLRKADSKLPTGAGERAEDLERELQKRRPARLLISRLLSMSLRPLRTGCSFTTSSRYSDAQFLYSV